MVVEANPLDEPFAKFSASVERVQVEVMVLDRPPQPFDEDVVLAAAAAVHADGDVVVLEDLSEGDAGELGALVGVEDLRLAVALQSLSERLDAELRVQGVGETLQERILRLCQSMTATRYMKPRDMGT